MGVLRNGRALAYEGVGVLPTIYTLKQYTLSRNLSARFGHVGICVCAVIDDEKHSYPCLRWMTDNRMPSNFFNRRAEMTRMQSRNPILLDANCFVVLFAFFGMLCI